MTKQISKLVNKTWTPRVLFTVPRQQRVAALWANQITEARQHCEPQRNGLEWNGVRSSGVMAAI